MEPGIDMEPPYPIVTVGVVVVVVPNTHYYSDGPPYRSLESIGSLPIQ
jgi:hypothetical protein